MNAATKKNNAPLTDAICWRAGLQGHGTLDDCDPEIALASDCRTLEQRLSDCAAAIDDITGEAAFEGLPEAKQARLIAAIENATRPLRSDSEVDIEPALKSKSIAPPDTDYGVPFIKTCSNLSVSPNVSRF